MTKTDRAAPVWERVSKNARMGSDRKRGLYVAARRLAAPGRAAVTRLGCGKLDEKRRRPDLDRVPRRELLDAFDPAAVHPRAVRRAEVLDHVGAGVAA